MKAQIRHLHQRKKRKKKAVSYHQHNKSRNLHQKVLHVNSDSAIAQSMIFDSFHYSAPKIKSLSSTPLVHQHHHATGTTTLSNIHHLIHCNALLLLARHPANQIPSVQGVSSLPTALLGSFSSRTSHHLTAMMPHPLSHASFPTPQRPKQVGNFCLDARRQLA